MKSKDALIKKELIHILKGQNNAHIHSLTQYGARFCYILFNNYFHPKIGEYDLVSPKYGVVTENGNFHLKGLKDAFNSTNSITNNNNYCNNNDDDNNNNNNKSNDNNDNNNNNSNSNDDNNNDNNNNNNNNNNSYNNSYNNNNSHNNNDYNNN